MTRLDDAWVLVGVLSLTVTVSYGTLMYAFPVMLAPMQADLGWSQVTLTSAFSMSALAGGVAAIPVGRWADRHGPRVVMTTGSIVATLLLLAWSRIDNPLTCHAVWIGLGVCSAAVFYEPAFVMVTHWFRSQRGRAFTVITVAGGLASTIFVPIASWLVSVYGWRHAVVWLAVMLGVLTILPHALLPRRPPSAINETGSGSGSVGGFGGGNSNHGYAGEHAPATAHGFVRTPRPVPTFVLRSATFRRLASAFIIATGTGFAIAVHIIPLLRARGYGMDVAAAALSLLGLAKLPGRLLVALLIRRMTTTTAIALVFLLQAAALGALIVLPGTVGLWMFVAVFGAGDGAATPARAAIIAEIFGSVQYGRISGILAFFLALGRAAAPIGVSIACMTLGGYDAVLWILVALMLLAAAGMVRVLRAEPFAHCVHLASGPSACMKTHHRSMRTTELTMTTQATRTADIIEKVRRILSGTPDPNNPMASACCSSEKQEVCCEPADKAGCCGTAPANSGTGCGCQ